jgi:hypothetical protein
LDQRLETPSVHGHVFDEIALHDRAYGCIGRVDRRHVTNNCHFLLDGSDLKDQIEARSLGDFQYNPITRQCFETVRLNGCHVSVGFQAREGIETVAIGRGLLANACIGIANLDRCTWYRQARGICHQATEFPQFGRTGPVQALPEGSRFVLPYAKLKVRSLRKTRHSAVLNLRISVGGPQIWRA